METQITNKDLSEFLKLANIPTVVEEIGFLDIIRKGHSENIYSNIYAYFLNCEDSAISQAFLAAIISIIETKSNKTFHFARHYATTEVTTNEGRVDIVVRDLLEPTTIIIENKIFHWLHNSLLEYWDYFKIEPNNKIGILLTVSNHDIPSDVQGKFVNITHWEWIHAVKQLLDFNEIKKEENKVYLKDFFNSIEKLSTTYKMNESAKFFFDHAAKINKAHNTIIEGHKFMIEQYQLIGAKLGLDLYGNDINYRNFWDEKNLIDTYFTVAAHVIISGKAFRYKIMIELIREDKARIEEILKVFGKHNLLNDKYRGETTDHYSHLVVKEYEITLPELGHFADHVVKNIRNDFGVLFIELVKYLYPNLKSYAWEQNLLSQ